MKLSRIKATIKYIFSSRSKRIEIALKIVQGIESFNESKFFDISEYIISLLPYGTYGKKVMDVIKNILPDIEEILMIMDKADNSTDLNTRYETVSKYLAEKKGSDLSAEVLALIYNSMIDNTETKKDESLMTAMEAAIIYNKYKK